ncbi:MAG: tetratricopeptide repeat protein, partial [Pyrinomonadaceae bacterium]
MKARASFSGARSAGRGADIRILINTCLTLAFVVLLSWPGPHVRAQTAGGTAAATRFVSGELAFEYPAGWQASEQSDREKIVVALKRAGLDAEINVVMLRLPVTASEILAAFRSGIVVPYVEQLARTLEAAGGSVERVASRAQVGGVAAEGTRLLVESDEGAGMGEIYSLLLNERLLIVGFQRSEKAATQATPVWDQVLGSLRIGGGPARAAAEARPEEDSSLSNADLKRGLAVIEEIGALTKQVLKLHAEGNFSRAIPLAEQALALAEKGEGLPAEMGQQLIAGSLNVLAEMHRANGDYARAEPLFQRSLSIYEKQYGPESDKLAAPLNNLATLYL